MQNGEMIVKFLLRDEARETERRTPIIPTHAAALVKVGIQLDVESSEKRIFSDHEYEQAGCRLVPSATWTGVSADTLIIGLKELPERPLNLNCRMVHFAHVYKDQTGWEAELKRFSRGGGTLYDIEYLTRSNGRRVAAFGYWAGWMGAALAVWRYLAIEAGEPGPDKALASFDSREQIVEKIKALAEQVNSAPKAIVIGAKGRSGSGAVAALRLANAEITEWDIEETANLDRDALLSHEILVNCVLINSPGLLLATPEHLCSANSHLRMISDVACDPFSSFNPLPVYGEPTSWEKPFIKLGSNGQGEDIELTSIDNLPSLIPKESSEDFSEQFLPSLMNFDQGEEWLAAKTIFERKLKENQK